MSLGNALSYLTVVPVPFKKHIPLQRSVHFFPLVGAGMGSLLVIAFIALKALLPPGLACLAAILIMEALTGGIHLRAVSEIVDGRRTYPGSGFEPKAEFHWKGLVAVAAVVACKVLALANIRPDWQPFAMLLAPILGRSSQALGIIFSRHRLSMRGAYDAAEVRMRRRALVFTASLMLVFALFPWKVAVILAIQYFAILVIGYNVLNRKLDGLTVQTMGTISQLAEASFLVLGAWLS